MPPAHHQHYPVVEPPPKKRRLSWINKELRYSVFVVMVGCALILSILAFWLAVGPVTKESDLIAKNRYQALFLNGGFDAAAGTNQPVAYFGHITKLNEKYFVLQDVFYITSQAGSGPSAQAQSTSALVKLGCDQLHAPYDQMIVNRSQVAYWENLQDSGKVVQTIQTYKKQNPNGPSCTAPSSSTAPATSTPTNTTAPATNTTKTP